MRNGPTLPLVALVVAIVLAIIVIAWSAGQPAGPLSELAIGGVAIALTLAIFGVQGLLSVLLEGETLTPGRMPPRLTGPLSAGIVIAAILLLADAIALGWSLVDGWATAWIGAFAAIGCGLLALILVFYKEGFVGDEAGFDDRNDGIPW
ncbi:MAG TPA: hypothetical protein VFQ80_12470 [Thermomicrobiales bacterium]|nr:hypothetical protein [Thermomicrobiales bacterium]